MRHILVRHEQAATHAADGYARATGKPGVALVTSGPGATNAVTGIATAYMDSIPMVVLTGQVPTPFIGRRRLPGGGHHRHHPSLREAAIFSHQAGGGYRGDPCQGVLYRHHRASRPGAGDIPKDVTDPGVRIPYDYPKKISMRSYRPVEKGIPSRFARPWISW